MKIVITGTPGVGKSTVAEKLAEKLGLKLYKEKEIVVGKKIGGEIEADLGRLAEFFKDKDNFVAEGHLLCEISIKDAIVFVLRCDPHILKKRLKERGYDEQKILDNLICEALDYCTIMAEKNYEKVFEIDVSKKSVDEVVEKILKIIKGEEKGEKVDFSHFILELY